MVTTQRELARIIAFKILYNRLLTGENPFADTFLYQQANLIGEVKKFSETLVETAWENRIAIEDKVQEVIVNANKDRMQTNLNALFLLSVAELFYMPKQDKRIIINEALNICRRYVGENIVALCNGVLHKLSQMREETTTL